MADEIKRTISLERLFLAVDNPRHEAVKDETGAIAKLCASENIVQLAADIAKNGINPAERLIVVPQNEDGSDDENSVFIVAEGNRRVCAMKLLTDPDRAPSDIRPRIEKYALEWEPIKELDAVVIMDDERREHWMLRIHDGAQDGRGRKAWNAEQKTRFTKSGKNVVAQRLLDYAEDKGLLSKDDRKGRISHMSRLVGNPLVRDALGLSVNSDEDGLSRTRPERDFDAVLKVILAETKEKNLGSQAKSSDIGIFADELRKVDGYTGSRTSPVKIGSDSKQDEADDPQDEITETDDDKTPKKPKQPPGKVRLLWSQEIADELAKGNFQKLGELYFSVCDVSPNKYPPLVTIGVWSFLESLSDCCGNTGAFSSFWSKGKLSLMGVATGDDARTINDALERIARAGNVTKHHAISGHFDEKQLANDWATIQPLLLPAIKEAVANV